MKLKASLVLKERFLNCMGQSSSAGAGGNAVYRKQFGFGINPMILRGLPALPYPDRCNPRKQR
jgi:hypothetical protein